MRINGEAASRAVDQSKRSFSDLRDKKPVTIPGILAQLTHAFVQFNRTAKLDRLEAGLVQLGGDGKHHSRPHSISPETLLSIAESRIDKTHVHSVSSNQF